MRVIVVEPGAVATELVDHITHGETIIRFAVTRPHGVSLNEILVRPTGQQG